MEIQNPSFSFPLAYAGQMVNCTAMMGLEDYDIFFDDRYMGSITVTDEWTWIQASGVILPKAIIEAIGLRVESEYK